MAWVGPRPARCGSHARHWFTIPGAVGYRRPDCTRCGAPNPRPLTEAEQAEFDAAVRQGWARPAREVSPDPPGRQQEGSTCSD